jgi:hypothetical protein
VRVHTLDDIPWQQATFMERLATNMTIWTLSPLEHDQRVTVLMSLLVPEIAETVAEEDEIDAILAAMKLHLQLVVRRQ